MASVVMSICNITVYCLTLVLPHKSITLLNIFILETRRQPDGLRNDPGKITSSDSKYIFFLYDVVNNQKNE